MCFQNLFYTYSSWSLRMCNLVLCKSVRQKNKWSSVRQKIIQICSYFQYEILFLMKEFIDSELPSAEWQRLLNKFVTFNDLFLGGWQPSFPRSLETCFARMLLSYAPKSNVSYTIFSAILTFFWSSISSFLLDLVPIRLWSFPR